MSWITFGNKYYYKGTTSGSPYQKSYYIRFQYDDGDSSSATHLSCRAVFSSDKPNNILSDDEDYFYLYFPSLNSSSLIHKKGIITGVMYFTLTKNYIDRLFKVPEFWIINQRDVVGTLNLDLVKESYVTKYTTALPSYEGVVASPLTDPTGSIKDNGDNTYTIRFDVPADAENNKVLKAMVYWNTDGNLPTTTNFSKYTETVPSSYNANQVRSYLCKVSVPSNSATSIVQALICIEGEYNNTSTLLSSVPVNYYVAPINQLKPDVTPYRYVDNFNYKLLSATKGCALYVLWKSAIPGNSSSPNNKCRLYIRTKKKGSSSWKYHGGKTDDAGHLYYDLRYINGSYTTDGLTVSGAEDVHYIFVDTKNYDIINGDTIQFGIAPVHSHELPSGDLFEKVGTTVMSDEIKLINFNIIDVKDNKEWKSSMVYIKVNSEWKPATEIRIKKSNKWILSKSDK